MIETKFKDTALGLIPNDWIEATIANTFTHKRNNTLSRDCLNYSDSYGVKNVHYGDILIKFGSFIDASKESLPYINREVNINPDYLSNGDLIIADTAEDEIVGKTSEIIGIGSSDKIVAGLHTIVLSPLESFAPKFLGYLMNGYQYHRTLIPFMQGTKVISITKKALSSTIICYPKSQQEQERIAETLTDVDSLISELTLLIEKKRSVLKGTMQELLTARRRLPGFSKVWRDVKLKTLVKMNSGGTPSTANEEYYNGNIPFLSISDISASSKYLISTQKHITEDGLNNSSARIFPKGTLLVSMYASIGKCIISSIDVAISQAILGFIPLTDDFDVNYLYYSLLYHQEDLATSGQTGTQSNLNKKIVENFSIELPDDKAEQQGGCIKLSSLVHPLHFIASEVSIFFKRPIFEIFCQISHSQESKMGK